MANIVKHGIRYVFFALFLSEKIECHGLSVSIFIIVIQLLFYNTSIIGISI